MPDLSKDRTEPPMTEETARRLEKLSRREGQPMRYDLSERHAKMRIAALEELHLLQV